MTACVPPSVNDVPRGCHRAARLRRLGVAASFPLVFLIHDGEELLAARFWQRRAPLLLREKFPRLPQPVVEAVAVGPGRMRKAVAIVAGGVAAVSALSLARTDRPTTALRCLVAVFGTHALTHVAQALVLRAYTPGVISAGLLVAPYAAWAWATLDKADGSAGLAFAPALRKGAPPVLALVAVAHLLAAATQRCPAGPPAERPGAVTTVDA